MISEPTLNKISAAFIQLSQTTDLQGWRLDPLGWNYNGKQETDDTDIQLFRSQSERASLTILPEPGSTVESLRFQIQKLMVSRGLISE